MIGEANPIEWERRPQIDIHFSRLSVDLSLRVKHVAESESKYFGPKLDLTLQDIIGNCEYILNRKEPVIQRSVKRHEHMLFNILELLRNLRATFDVIQLYSKPGDYERICVHIFEFLTFTNAAIEKFNQLDDNASEEIISSIAKYDLTPYWFTETIAYCISFWNTIRIGEFGSDLASKKSEIHDLISRLEHAKNTHLEDIEKHTQGLAHNYLLSQEKSLAKTIRDFSYAAVATALLILFLAYTYFAEDYQKFALWNMDNAGSFLLVVSKVSISATLIAVFLFFLRLVQRKMRMLEHVNHQLAVLAFEKDLRLLSDKTRMDILISAISRSPLEFDTKDSSMDVGSLIQLMSILSKKGQ